MSPKEREVSIEQKVFPELQAMGTLRVYVSSAYWREIGTPRSYLATSHDVLSGAVGLGRDFQYASIHPSAIFHKDVTLLPPAFVVEGCEVEAGTTTVGGRTSLGRGCLIGEEARVEGSILFEGVRVGEGTVVRNSIAGPGAEIGTGCIVGEISVLGARCVVEEGNVLDQGARVNPRVRLQREVLTF